MFGCGKYDEIKMLGYLDGIRSGDGIRAIEDHLMECGACLEEMAELNRIQAETEPEGAPGLDLPRFITVFAGDKGEKGGWEILRAVVSAVSARWEPLAATRGEGIKRAVSFVTGESRVTVKIVPAASGSFWLSFSGESLQGRTVEFGKKGDELPLFSRKAGTKEVLIRGVGPGEYEAKFANETVRINLRTEDAEIKSKEEA